MRFTLWVNKATDTHSYYVICGLFHSKNVYANAPLWYIIAHCLFCLAVC